MALKAEVLFTRNGLPDKQVDLCSNGSHAHIVKDGHCEEGNELAVRFSSLTYYLNLHL